jgi:hypothetical protein
MLKYLGIGLLFSGLLTLEAACASFPGWRVFFPDCGLLVMLLYGFLGRGDMLVPLALLCGFIRGCGSSVPSGYFILAYLFVGYSLLRTRNLFFLDHPLIQFFASAFLGFITWLFLVLCHALRLIPSSHPEILERLAYACLSTALLTPVFIALGKRLVRLRKRFIS